VSKFQDSASAPLCTSLPAPLLGTVSDKTHNNATRNDF